MCVDYIRVRPELVPAQQMTIPGGLYRAVTAALLRAVVPCEGQARQEKGSQANAEGREQAVDGACTAE